jgi:hypothetical protein
MKIDGECAELAYTLDWSQHPLGTPANWHREPQLHIEHYFLFKISNVPFLGARFFLFVYRCLSFFHGHYWQTWIVIAAMVIFFGVSLLSFYLNPTQVQTSN